VLCAFGDAATSLRAERSRSLVRKMSDLDPTEFRSVVNELADQVDEELRSIGVSTDLRELRCEADVRYFGQGFELSVAIDLEASPLEAMRAQFEEAHRRLFGFALDDEQEVMGVRVIGTSMERPITPPRLDEDGTDSQHARLGAQRAYLDRAWVEAGLYDRSALRAGNVVEGPAVVMEMDSTTLVLPGCSATVDSYGNLIIRPNGADER
jgi:N-methylhydantoinase A